MGAAKFGINFRSMRLHIPIAILALAGTAGATFLALQAPTEVQQPGTQPLEVVSIENSENCRSCHAYYAPATEPYQTWQGSMMAHAGRDPVFWAALAIAEQGFDGVGDQCLRCHSPTGWLEGRASPTDGSGLDPLQDGRGVECMLCHRLTDPDKSEHLGTQNAPFLAHTPGPNPEGFYGSGMFVLADSIDRYGPYGSGFAAHGTVKSNFHRDSALCGTCHDVSNPVTGDLAHNNGGANTLAPGQYSGVLGSPVAGKAAFLNKPHGYGTVERTYSEHQSSAWANTKVSDYATLPVDLQQGIVEQIYQASLIAGNGGDYEDGTTRLFSCQSCHMRPTEAYGSSFGGVPLRKDMPIHDLTGGNTRVGDMIIDLDSRGKLRVGGNLLGPDRLAIEAGQDRARETLRSAAGLSVQGNSVRVTNLTGHKLTTGYSEGRRMWLHIRWYDGSDQLLREDGSYGQLNVNILGRNLPIETILDLDDPNTRIWQVKPGIDQQWASQLVALGNDPATPLVYDRVNGAVLETLGGLASKPAGAHVETFHFALNNMTVSDNRIPPFGMDYDMALERDCLPVPSTLFGNPGAGGSYEHWDDVALNPPAGAARGEIRLLYQVLSWEYLEFLLLANDGSVSSLASAGLDLARSWYRTGMAKPEVMAQISWP